ncbi:MAG: methionine--tRNA ligase [Verrucomicrobia bacterium 21-51-4]|nr:MAG: methionine--tRNA ligase [Verrucomicrobia bacterium 21-51-4]
MKKFYITTAIDYVNGAPHLGHAYEKVLADVIARWQRMQGQSVYFLTGTDEHGQKVQQSAERSGVEPQAWCDQVSERFKDLCKRLEVSNDDFIRTTEPRHKVVVADILTRLHNEGKIYKADYRGFYSARQEQFLQEKDRLPDGSWPEIFGEVVEITESNYFFKLSEHQQWLIDHIQANEAFIFPKFRAKQVLEFLKEPLNDLCISRPKERLSWGIPLPFDNDYVTYVWFDALINYISAVHYGQEAFAECWPVDYHVIGKDILVPPHAVYWPIMLKACGVAAPKTILAHGWWLVSGEKMSKSIGNVVDPLDLIEQFGPDAFRYYLIREMNVGQDADFTAERFLIRYTSDLGNDLGNLLSRLLNMVTRYCGGVVPAAVLEEAPEASLHTQWSEVAAELPALFEGLQFHSGLDKLWEFIRALNRYAELRAPWKLAKSTDPKDRALLDTSLSTIAEGLRLTTIFLTPVMPAMSAKIRGLLGLQAMNVRQQEAIWDNRTTGSSVAASAILFPRHEPVVQS